MSFFNTKTTVTFLKLTLHSHTRFTLLLRVADGYVECLHLVLTDKFNTLLKNKGNAFVKTTHRRVRVTTVGAEIKKIRAGLVQFVTSTRGSSLVKIMPIGD